MGTAQYVVWLMQTPRVAISNIGKCVGCLIEPSPPTASCKMSGNKPGGLRTANCSHNRLKKLQPLMIFLKIITTISIIITALSSS